MGYQVIRQPDGKLAVFSSYMDCWAVYDGSPEEIVEWFAEKAAEDAREHARRIVGNVMAGEPRKAYYQFTMTFDQANAKSKEHGGVVLAVSCCDLHGHNCEPEEPCCENCTEVRHAGWRDDRGVKRYGHPAGEACVDAVMPP